MALFLTIQGRITKVDIERFADSDDARQWLMNLPLANGLSVTEFPPQQSPRVCRS